MMTLWSFTAFLFLILQAGEGQPAAAGVFTPGEQVRIDKESNVEQRIKVYEAASKRLQQSLQTHVAKEEFDPVPDTLQTWTALLSKSLQDIEVNLKTKKKSKALKNFEIQLRKSISDTQSFKIRAPAEQQDAFDSCLDQAEKIRKRFVEILFRH